MKKHLYISLLRPIITYGAERWHFRKKEERKLMVFERKILKKTFRPAKEEKTGECRVRKNNEFDKLFQRQKHNGHNQKPKITVGRTRLAKPKPTFTHGNGRKPSRKNTT